MNPGELSERDILNNALWEDFAALREYAEKPENRARRLSLALTNIEQGLLWLRDHIIYDPLPGEPR